MTVLDAPPLIAAMPGGPADLAALVRHAVEGGGRREILVWRPARAVSGGTRAHHRRLLDTAAAPLRMAPRLRLFRLPDGGLVASAVPPALALATAESALRNVLDPADADVALQRLRLPEDAVAILALLEASLIGPARPPGRDDPAGDSAEAPTRPGMLEALGQADLSAHLVRQTVCRLDPDGSASPGWTDERPDWSSLLAIIGAASAGRPDVALMAAVAGRQAAGMARSGGVPLSLPLPPMGVATDDWLRMDTALPAAARRGVTVCLDLGAILRQPTEAVLAARFCRLRGYGVAVDVASADALPLITPALLADFPEARLRLAWSNRLPRHVGALDALGDDWGANVWLAGVDRAGAVAWGWSQGIRLFQGPLVDRLR
ncbi:hypothetical protein ACQW02_23615 [Humitalea sp. 24SJ18S-53]|uniref:hypothetical protein n=1 Tax=Humitalea sp. 24SJ18S-53 TaxID=3422307 RepID=UPI003D66B000